MIVNQQNFLKESNNLIQKLPTASFFTLNLQLTGRNIPNASRPSKFDQPFERYSQLKNSPERYSIIQMGICLFHENPDFRRYAKRFVGEGGDNDDEDGGEDGDAAGEHPAAENIRDREQLEDARNQENMMPLHNYNHANQDHNNNNNLSDDESDEHSYISSSSSDQSSDSDSDGDGENGRGPERDDGNDHAHENRNANENVDVNANANENANINNDHVENNDNGNDNQHQEQQQQEQQEQHQPGDQPNDDPNGQPDHLPNIGLPILFDRLRNHNRHRNRNHNRDQNRGGGRRRPEPPEFHVRKYNFFLFPSSNSSAREVVLNPAMMTQLCGGRQDRNRTNGNGRDADEENVAQDVDFNEWMKNGITYTTLEQAEAIMKKFQLDHDKKLNGNSNGSEHANGNGTNDEKDGAQNRGTTNGARVTEWDEPTDPSDIAFIARTMASLREWIDQAALPSVPLSDNMSLEQEERIGIVKVIPVPKKESLRRCLRGKIEFEYPSLHWDENDNQQVVIRLNDDEKKIRDARRKKFAWQKMHEERIGFTRVFKALSDACRGQLGQIEDFDSEYQHFCAKFEESDDHSTSGSPSSLKGDGSPVSVTAADLTKLSRVQQRQIPMILHDGFLDFLFLLTHFQKHKLPPTYEEAKEMLHRFFPVVYDTKILASEFSDNAVKTNKTSAYDLYRRFVRGRGDDVFEEDHEFVGGRIPRSLLVNGSTLSLTHPEADENPDLNPGDNAFIIGTVFQCLCRRIKWRSLQSPTTEEREREMFSQIVSAKRSRVGSLLFLDQRHAETKLCAPLYGLNKVFLHQSIFTVDMEAVHDPLKPGYTMTAIFKVMHPNKIVTLNEINRIIKGIRDPGFAGRHSQPKIHYEIGLTSKWFIVAARNKIPRGMNPSDPSANAFAAATLERRATLLLDALKSNFPECEITSLEDAVLSSTSGWSSLKRGKKRNIRQTDQVERDDDNNGILGALYSTVRSGLRRRLRVE